MEKYDACEQKVGGEVHADRERSQKVALQRVELTQ